MNYRTEQKKMQFYLCNFKAYTQYCMILFRTIIQNSDFQEYRKLIKGINFLKNKMQKT